jgi:hypothetical protein
MATSVKTSPSDLTTRKPVSEQASADVRGVAGLGAAAFLIKTIGETADKVVTVLNAAEKSLKACLADLLPLSGEDHVAYRDTLRFEVAKLNKMAEDAKISMTDYRAADKRVNYLYVTLSEWGRLSSAIQSGYLSNDPAYKDKPWGEIKRGASDWLKTKAAEIKQAELSEQAKKIAEDLKRTDLKAADRKVAEASLALVNAQIEAGPVNVPSGKGGRNRVTKSLIDEMKALVSGRPIGDIEAAFVWLGTYIVEQYKPAARVVNTELKRVEAATKGQGVPAEVKLNEQEHAANDHHEKAVAKSGKRGSKSSKK